MGANYNKLKRKLESSNNLELSFSFSELEGIIESQIQNVYKERRTFKQASSRFQIYAKKAGYIVSDVDYNNERITFCKNNVSSSNRNTEVSSRISADDNSNTEAQTRSQAEENSNKIIRLITAPIVVNNNNHREVQLDSKKPIAFEAYRCFNDEKN